MRIFTFFAESWPGTQLNRRGQKEETRRGDDDSVRKSTQSSSEKSETISSDIDMVDKETDSPPTQQNANDGRKVNRVLAQVKLVTLVK